MMFDHNLFDSYRTLLQSTDLQRAYQEFIRWFRYLRSQLERQMPDFRFQNGISENAMDYAYFSFFSQMLKENNLKLVVVFVHKSFQLEVWLSGTNRSAQCRWADRMRDHLLPMGMEATDDPEHTDYLVRLPVQVDLPDGDAAVAAVKVAAEKLAGVLL